MKIKEILRKTVLNSRISPFDAEILLSLSIRRSREYILAHPEKKITTKQIDKVYDLLKKRLSGEPMAYIAGKKEFYGLDFIVNKDVLIPRPETELAVEESIEKIKNKKYQTPDTLIDIGTGSGNIIVSIAKNIPKKNKINFYAVDISQKALRIAKKNAKMHRIEKKIKFLQSDLLEYFFKHELKTRNLFIIANLPYVSPIAYKKNLENLKFEPEKALVSSKKGLWHYDRLLRQIGDILVKYHKPRVTCYIEISPEQKPEISRILGKYLPNAKVRYLKDLAGKWRIAEAAT